MFGLVIGTICLLLLIGVLRRRWYPGGHGYGHRWRGHGPRAFLWRLLRRIDATPAQEKVFRDEADGFWEAAGGLREGLKASRRDLALAMRDEALDKQKLAAMFRKQDEILGGLRERLSASLERVHATLDARQRGQLADLLERGGHSAHC
jgi:hypothetical protein